MHFWDVLKITNFPSFSNSDKSCLGHILGGLGFRFGSENISPWGQVGPPEILFSAQFGPRGPKLSLQDDPQKHAFYCSKSTISALGEHPKAAKNRPSATAEKNTKLGPSQEGWGWSSGSQKGPFWTPRGRQGLVSRALGRPKAAK